MQDELVVGGIYSVEDGAGKIGVVKVLALEPGIAHVRIYRNKFETRPASVDPAILSLGSVFEDADFGIGHAPLAREGFLAWQPVLLIKTDVTEDELVGYKLWKESTQTGSAKPFSATLGNLAKRVKGIVRRDRPN